MNKNFKKVLIAALTTSAMMGGGTLTSHADSLDVEPNTEPKNNTKEEIDDGIAKVEEIQDETVENIRPVNNEVTEEKVEEQTQPVNNANIVEEKTQPVNNANIVEEKTQPVTNEETVEEKTQPVNNEITEEKVQTQNNNTNNKETLTENKDNSLEMSEEKKVDKVKEFKESKESKESKEKSTRGIEELNKLDNKNLNKDRLQFLEKLASAIDNVPYKGDVHELSTDPEYKKYYTQENPDSLTCSEFMSWGLYQTGHKEVENHYVRDFYADTKNFTHLSDKDTLTPGDFILDYRPGNRTGHILVYAGKDADGNEIVLHSTRDKGSNPNEKQLQNGPNIIKRSDYKIVNSYPIFVRYNGFEKVEKLPTDTDNNYASETNKNTIDNFQVDDIKITRADDPSKESYFESPYNFNISFSNIGKIKEGDSLKLIGYYPKLYNTETKEEYHFGVFPYTSKDYNETVRQDIKIKYNNKDIVIGQLVGNKITFNKNVESLDKFNFSVSLGIATKNRLNVEKEGRKDVYEVPFYVKINGKALSKPYLQKIKPNTRENLVLESSNYVRGRIYHLPTEKNKQVMYLYDSPFNTLAKLRDENRWKDDKISVKITLPEGLEFNSNQNIEKQILTYYSNEKKIVLAANHDINRHYAQHQGILSSLTTIKDNKTAINNFDITDKPLADGEGDYDRTIVGALVSIMNSDAVDLKTGKLKNPIKFEYFVNDKLVDTKELTDIEIQTTSSSSGGSAEQSHKTTKEEIKAKMFYETDDSLEFGKQVVVKKPVNGEKEITITKKIVDGKVVEEKSEKVIKQKQDGLTKIGNKKVVEEEVPPIKGGTKPGKKTTTTIYEVDKNTGKLINPKETVKVVYPAEKIQDISKKVTHKDINYNTIYKKDETLKHGEKKIIQKGVKGNKEITQIGSNKPTEKIIKKPIDEIINVGNKKVVEEDVPAIDGGKPGKKITTTIWDVDPKTGELINPKETVKIIYPMEEIEDIGVKTTKTKGEISFKIVYVADASLEYGKTRVFQEGVKGVKEITTISKVVDGKRVEENSEQVLEKPTTKIIGVGNRKKIKEEIPYKTITEKSKDLEVGKSEVKTKGQVGEKEISIVSEVDPKTGELIGEKKDEKINKDPIDEVILIGTKKIIPWTEIQDIAKRTSFLAAKIQDIAKKTSFPAAKIQDIAKKTSFPAAKIQDIAKKTSIPAEKIQDIAKKTSIPAEKIQDIAKKTSIPAEKIQDIAKPIEKEQPKEDGNGKAKEQPKEETKEQPVRQAMAPIAHPNVQTGVSGIGSVLTTALMASVSLAVTKKKKED